MYFASGVTQQARDATQRTRRLLDFWRGYRNEVTGAIRTGVVLRLVDELFNSPYITMARAATVMGVARNNAQRNLEKLIDLGIIREITGQQRYRVYCADEILRLLEEPLEESSAT